MENKELGRNDPCPCGSGKKYKRCCWDVQQVLRRNPHADVKGWAPPYFKELDLQYPGIFEPNLLGEAIDAEIEKALTVPYPAQGEARGV